MAQKIAFIKACKVEKLPLYLIPTKRALSLFRISKLSHMAEIVWVDIKIYLHFLPDSPFKDLKVLLLKQK